MFPQLPSGQNPYGAMAAEFARTAASLDRGGETRKQAKARQAAAKAEKDKTDQALSDQRSAQHELEVARLGGIPEFTGTAPSGAGNRPTLTKQEPNPDIPDNPQGYWVTNPESKNRSYIPSKAEAEAKQGKTVRFSQEQVDEGKKVGITNLQPDHDYPIEVFNGLNAALNEYHRRTDPTYTPHEVYDDQGNSQGIFGYPNKPGAPYQYPAPGQQPAQTPAAPAQGGSPNGPFALPNPAQTQGVMMGAAPPPPSPMSDSASASFVNALHSAANQIQQRVQSQPTSPFTAQPPPGAPTIDNAGRTPMSAPPAQTPAAPAQGGGYTFRPQKAERKETPDDWVRIKTDPKSSPAEVKRATAALAESRAGQTEADKDRHERQQELAADRAERQGERQDIRVEAQAKINRNIEGTKKKAIAKAISDYRKATKDTYVTPELKKTALDQLRSDLDEAQRGYESDVSTETGQDIPHSRWAETYDPDAPGGQSPASPGRGGRGGTPNPFRAAPAAPKNPFR